MKVRLNEDAEIVRTIREGLRRTAATVPAVWPARRRTAACAGSSRSRSQTPTTRATATAACITRKSDCPAEKRAALMRGPLPVYPLISSRTSPMTDSTTPPSSMKSAMFHTSRPSFFPVQGSCT